MHVVAGDIGLAHRPAQQGRKSTTGARRIERGEWSLDTSPLRHAPHTSADLVAEWTRPYTRETAVFPLLPILQQQGMMLDAQGLVRMLARDLGLSEELGNIIIFAAPNDPQQQDAARQEQSTKPPVSTRTYKRINETPQKVGGADADQQQMRDLLQMSANRKGAA